MTSSASLSSSEASSVSITKLSPEESSSPIPIPTGSSTRKKEKKQESDFSPTTGAMLKGFNYFEELPEATKYRLSDPMLLQASDGSVATPITENNILSLCGLSRKK
jgi:hypothetical protein